MTTPLQIPLDPWDTRFGFLWYSDKEIFDFTAADFRRRAEEFAATGVNHVITMSGTHFRWSFRRDWGRITDTLGKVVEACHQCDIRVTEHHSTHLTFNPLDQEQEAWMDQILRFNGSSRAAWPHLREDCDADPDIGGALLSSCRQISGLTGQWARSAYGGWCLCFNNPDYRRAYLAYLETQYAVGIDGIMTDDVQWYGHSGAGGHSCACGHCRNLYSERTGFDLPAAGSAWEKWFGNYDDPSYVAWLNFRLTSNEDFHAAVGDHYRGLGLRMLRPNYCSGVLCRNWTGYILETLPDLDWIFQECCDSAIIRYSWMGWAVEASHRFAVGRRRKIPAMAMFYPQREDDLVFTWALAMSWGQMYLESTLKGEPPMEAEKPLRAFEQRHARVLREQRKFSRLAFYDSRANRNFYRDAEARSLPAMQAWMQACYRDNVPHDLFHREELRRLLQYKVVVLNEAAILSDVELSAFYEFVRQGGCLVWTGLTGTLKEDGTTRTVAALQQTWGETIEFGVANDGPIMTYLIGQGGLATVAGDFGVGPVEPPHWAYRYQEPALQIPFDNLDAEARATWRHITDFLTGLLPDGPDMEMEHLPPDVLVTAFETADSNSLVLHLVNAAETLAKIPGEMVSHDDTIPFPRHSGPTIRIALRKPDSWQGRDMKSAAYHDPDKGEPAVLSIEDQGDIVVVDVAPEQIGRYGLVILDAIEQIEDRR